MTDIQSFRPLCLWYNNTNLFFRLQALCIDEILHKNRINIIQQGHGIRPVYTAQ